MEEKIPSLEGLQLYPQDPSVDRRLSLHSVLSRTHTKCDALEAQLAELRMSAQGLASPTATVAAVVPVGGQASSSPEVGADSLDVIVFL